jgi:pimeloyl-CoA synthetase
MKLNSPLGAFTASLIIASLANAQEHNINALAVIESGGNMKAVGAKGERTAWQIMDKTWNCYVQKGERRSSTKDAFNVASRIYAHNYIRYVQATSNRPTHTDVYAMWNLGFVGYKKRGFLIERCPRITIKAAARYSEICMNNHQEN